MKIPKKVLAVALFLIIGCGGCGAKRKYGLTFLEDKSGYDSPSKETRKVISPGALYYNKERIVAIRKVKQKKREEPKDRPLYEGGPTFETEYGESDNYADNPEKLILQPRKPLLFRKDVPEKARIFLREYILKNGIFVRRVESIGNGEYLFYMLGNENFDPFLKNSGKRWQKKHKMQEGFYLVSAQGILKLKLDMRAVGIEKMGRKTAVISIKKLHGRIFVVLSTQNELADKQFRYEYDSWLAEIELSKQKVVPLLYKWSKDKGVVYDDVFLNLQESTNGEINFQYGLYDLYYIQLTKPE